MFSAVTSTVITNRLVQSSEISPPRPPGLAVSTKKPLPRPGTALSSRQNIQLSQWKTSLNSEITRGRAVSGSETDSDGQLENIQLWSPRRHCWAIIRLIPTIILQFRHWKWQIVLADTSDTLLFIYMLKPKPQLTRPWDISNELKENNNNNKRNSEMEFVSIILR